MGLLPVKASENSTRPVSSSWRRVAPGVALALMLATFAQAGAAQHVLSSQDLHAAVAARQRHVKEHRATLLRTLGNPQAQKALNAVGIEFRQVEQAVAALDDATAERLAKRAAEVNREFAAGALSNEMLTYIVIALATAVLVIIAVN